MTTNDSTADAPAATVKRPAIEVKKLLIVASGAVNAIQLPYWLTWLRASYPQIETRVVLTHSAERFVAPQAVAALSGNAVVRDRWPDEATTALHVELATWADAIMVYPASLHFLSRFALGLADSPSVLALQCATVPVCLAPSLPPGVEDTPVYQDHLASLARRPNVVVAPTQTGRSLTTGRQDARAAAPMWTVLSLLEEVRKGTEDLNG